MRRKCWTCGKQRDLDQFRSPQNLRCTVCDEQFAKATCENCGGPVPLNARGYPRKFCPKQDCQAASHRKAVAVRERKRPKRKSRVCPACRTRKPLTEEFWVAEARHPDGTVKVFQSYCRPCAAAYALERYRTDERRRVLARTRARKARERRLAGIPPKDRRKVRGVPVPPPKQGDNMELPIEPFAQWLEGRLKRFDDDLARFARTVGYEDDRTLRRIRDREEDGKPKHYVRLDTVDRVLTRDGSTFLHELYPELYSTLEDVA